jgi:urea carboxylase
VWNRFRRTREFQRPWLLRFFDQIRFVPVTADELLEWRRDLPLGRVELDIAPSRLRLRDHLAFLEDHASDIAAFRDRQQRAFGQERARWEASGEFDRVSAPVGDGPELHALEGATVVEAALHASVWQVVVDDHEHVEEGDVLVVLEAMKMETPVRAPARGRVQAVLVRPGQEVRPGQPLVALAS